LPLRFEELGPRRFLEPVWRGLEALFAEDVGDRPSRNLMMEIRQGALDPRVPPTAVLGGHAHDQRADLAHDRWPSRTTAVLESCCAEMRVRCHASSVSGVTTEANSRSTRRPSVRAFAASRRR